MNTLYVDIHILYVEKQKLIRRHKNIICRHKYLIRRHTHIIRRHTHFMRRRHSHIIYISIYYVEIHNFYVILRFVTRDNFFNENNATHVQIKKNIMETIVCIQF